MLEDYTGDHSDPTGNPNYHQPSDTLDTLNVPFIADVARVTAATLIVLADG